MLAASITWTWIIIAHYWNQGLYVGVRELAYFYVEVPVWKVVTGRIPHDRIHPRHADDGKCPCCSHEVSPVRSLGEFIAFQLIGLPMLISALMLKASAIIFGPLIYIGFAFRAADYRELSMNARKRYRSSFKQLWLTIAVMGILAFIVKFLIYSTWNTLSSWWIKQPLLGLLTPFIHPKAFLPFHLTSIVSAILLLVATALVDRAMHLLDDRALAPDSIAGLLKSILILARVRVVLSFYTWTCILWLAVPWLRFLKFPPVSFEIFPR